MPPSLQHRLFASTRTVLVFTWLPRGVGDVEARRLHLMFVKGGSIARDHEGEDVEAGCCGDPSSRPS
ncbi:hypothetical protein E2C01_085812 [Portunus trituberculatus]|uniref:Uncharacterized protein n=1 Tax=Portunus trituberculatus TaxID=210409 RepID=A0A5B7J203_PORTR|nr:hypothetical protein [Portunus trituberculatus]